MSDLLQQNLRNKAAQQNNLKLLESQWSFDKQLIPKVLQQVGQLFPHYSRHDQSHSEQILINIERLLGTERVAMLSATDVWLLLESAYWHDIGMVVPNDALKSALDTSEFKNYKRSIIDDDSHELHRFVKYFDGSDVTKVFSGADNPLDAITKFRLLMAEWFRRQHPGRAEKSVNDPWNELGLNSPRTELIPKRLFRILGSICNLHGSSFDEVLSQLPHKEVGMANDDCHPRFIACLLRLGDLLDMDDNRFCPVMQRIAGERPALSKAHEDKHSSIRHFRLDSDRIEVTAVCDSVEGYVEQWRWLEYLRGEMQCQMGRWQDIAPSAELGLLPTLGDIKVSISGRQLITHQGMRPEFTLNSDRVMKLLEGENLYKKSDTVRELLQNSVDATLLRVWMESKVEGNPIPTTPNASVDNFCERHPILIVLEKLESPDEIFQTEQVKWKFSLQDRGVGISQDDLKYIMSIGSSSRKSKKQLEIEEIPEWFKPSGTFGIGLQSVFMWADVVNIETKNIHTQELLNISLHSPSGPKKGLVTVELVGREYSSEVGTKISFIWSSDKVLKRFSISSDEKMTSAAYRTFDSILDGEIPFEALKICDAIVEFSNNSFLKIFCKLKFSDSNYFELSGGGKIDDLSSDFYSETNSVFKVDVSSKYQNLIYFRGQYVADSHIPSHYLFNYSLDLYSGKASEYLTFSRNGISASGRDHVEKIINRNLVLWAERNSDIESTKGVISLLAMHWKNLKEVEFLDNRLLWERISLKLSGKWKDLLTSVKTARGVKKEVKFSDVLVENYCIYLGSDADDILFPGSRTPVVPGIYKNMEIYRYLAADWCEDSQNGIKYVVGRFSKNKKDPEKCVMLKLVKLDKGDARFNIEDDALVLRLEKMVKNITRSQRILLPLSVFPDYLNLKILILKDGLKNRMFAYVFPWIPDVFTPHILLPFELKSTERRLGTAELERFDEFIRFIHSNLAVTVPIAQVREGYEKLIDYLDNEVMKGSTTWADARRPTTLISKAIGKR